MELPVSPSSSKTLAEIEKQEPDKFSAACENYTDEELVNDYVLYSSVMNELSGNLNMLGKRILTRDTINDAKHGVIISLAPKTEALATICGEFCRGGTTLRMLVETEKVMKDLPADQRVLFMRLVKGKKS